ncbi:ribosome small subunit-dependent GTPase A [Patescibacteria group bacterium]
MSLNDLTEKYDLLDLGYSEAFEDERKKMGLLNYSIARVIAEYKEAYRVKGTDGEYLAKITGKHMFAAQKREDYPAVGDWVVIEEFPERRAVIRGILPRKSVLKKKYSNKQEGQIIATNLDSTFIIESMDRDYNLNRIERYLVLVEEGKIKPVIILNKIDLISESELNLRIKNIKNRFKNVDILSTSAVLEQGFNKLLSYVTKGKTYCFLGSSGVGKSTLINKLLGRDEIKTREISISMERGKHTTTTREMYFLKNRGIVIDNPGTREVGVTDSTIGIENVFDEISNLSTDCKFSNCTHMHEPGCAVLRALKNGKIDSNKYANYKKLKKEYDYYMLTDIEKKEKDHRFGKFIKKAKEELSLNN